MCIRDSNITDPTKPNFFGNHPTRYAKGLHIEDHILYLVDHNHGLKIFDINDPASPRLIGSCDTPGYAEDIYIHDGLAYIADGALGLQIITIEQPREPLIIGSYNTPGYSRDIAISGDYAFLASDICGLEIIDISSPSSPVYITQYNTPNQAIGVVIKDSIAYVTGKHFGLEIVNITEPGNPEHTGSYETPHSSRGVFIQGHFAYVANYGNGLKILDITNPENPMVVGCYDTPGYSHDVFVLGDFAYIADYEHGLQIIDISNPTNPIFKGCYNTPGYAIDVVVRGGYAYVADYDHNVQIIDISNPESPYYVTTFVIPNYTAGIYIRDNLLYVAYSAFNTGIQWAGISIADITDPTNPVCIGDFNTVGYFYDLFISEDNIVYCSFTYKENLGPLHYGLKIIDVNNPESPSELGTYYITGEQYPKGIFVSGEHAFLASGFNRLEVIDISSPSNPELEAYYNTPGYAYDVFVDDGYIYVADESSVLILRLAQTKINSEITLTPKAFKLLQNYPNPFNNATTLNFSLPKPGQIKLSVYNLLGQQVATLFEGTMDTGEHNITWNTNDLPSGVYLARLQSNSINQNIKMLMLK